MISSKMLSNTINNINSQSNQNENAADKTNDISNSNSDNLFKLMKTKSLKNKNNTSAADLNTNSNSNSSSSICSTGSSGDQRTMDAADTLVSLAHSTSTTPTTEFKPFIQSNTSNNIEIFLNTTMHGSETEVETETQILENTIKLDDFKQKINSLSLFRNENSTHSGLNANTLINNSNSNSKEIVESACKILLEQVLKSCPNGNLSSITIKATAVPSKPCSLNDNKNDQIEIKSTTITRPPNSELLNNANNLNLELPIIKASETMLLNTSSPSSLSIESAQSSPLLNSCKQSKKARLGSSNPNEIEKEKLTQNDLIAIKQVNINSATSDSDSDSRLSNSLSINRTAPTLATGRRSKDISLPPDEAKKRQERRERNKEAAARCRRRREDLATTLSKKTDILNQEQENLKRKFQDLLNEKTRLEDLLQEHEKKCEKSNQFIKGDKKIGQKFFNSQCEFQQHHQAQNYEKEKSNSLMPVSGSSIALTPNSATFNMAMTNVQLENLLSQFEHQSSYHNNANNQSQNQSINLQFPLNNISSSLKRPDNLNLNIKKSQTSNLMTPSNASLAATSALIQGLTLALGNHAQSNNNPNYFSIGSNNNINFLLTPNLQLNTPTLTLTPIEAINAITSCNTPILSIPTFTMNQSEKSNKNNSNNNNNNSNSANSTNNNNLIKS